jgi:hypothetical protein
VKTFGEASYIVREQLRIAHLAARLHLMVLIMDLSSFGKLIPAVPNTPRLDIPRNEPVPNANKSWSSAQKKEGWELRASYSSCGVGNSRLHK